MAFTVDTPRERVRIYTDETVPATTFSDVITTAGAKAVFVSTTKASTNIWVPLWDTTEGRYAAQDDLTTTGGNSYCRELDISALGTNPTTTHMGVIQGDFMPERISIYNGAATSAGIQVIVVF